MTEVKYGIVEHDGGYAYKVGDVFSETFRTHEQALAAAKQAANRQQLAGETEAILYQDNKGKWHEELAEGVDRPQADVQDDPTLDEHHAETQAHDAERDRLAHNPLYSSERHERDESYPGRAPVSNVPGKPQD